MKIGDFLQNNANDLIGLISKQVGGPELPPLQFDDPYQNNNNYVEARPAPAAIQPETAAPAYRNWIMYGAIGLGVVLVVGMLVKRK